MTVGVRKRKKITEAQYLKMERASETKNEFRGGEIYAMTGASERHNLIAISTLASLYGQLRGRPCRVYPSDMRVKVAATGLYTYPDISVVCGPVEVADENRDTLLNPVLLIEILSKTTAGYDRGEKFEQYRKLPSLAEYLLISQIKCLIEHYLRQPDGKWLLSEYDALSDVVELPSIGCRLALADVYEQVAVVKEDGPAWNLSSAQETP
ncbi:MAG: Uma2 family endonuclease [Anaerolineae bacterium]|jgi:Uma2 family endonuclease|nr:Uma2 family endonuclease [Anaerolineae bacterium]